MENRDSVIHPPIQFTREIFPYMRFLPHDKSGLTMTGWGVIDIKLYVFELNNIL
jgi:hypothetical protein